MNTEISLGDLDDNKNMVGGIRSELNVNSPKGGDKSGFSFATPSNLVTQVNQEDEARQIEMAKQMVRNIDDEKESREEIATYERSPEPRHYSHCFSSLCCGLCSERSTHYQIPVEESSEYDNYNRSKSSDSSSAPQAVEADVVEQIDSIEDEYVLQFVQPEEEWLLHPAAPSDIGRKCLVLDLDETLVHSKFEPTECSFSITINLDGTEYGVYVRKRPFVDEFIAECAKMFELVVFTASLPEYANPVIDILDKHGLIKHRLFRGSCVFYEEQFYVKDLSRLGRNMKDCIIIDNSMLSFLFNPTNAIACTSWYGDKSDKELRDLLPVLGGPLLATNDVRTILDGGNQSIGWLIKQYGNKNSESESSSSY